METFFALAAIYAEDGSSPEATGWLNRAATRTDLETLQFWVQSRWFDGIRYKPHFREFLRKRLIQNTPAPSMEGDDDVAAPPLKLEDSGKPVGDPYDAGELTVPTLVK